MSKRIALVAALLAALAAPLAAQDPAYTPTQAAYLRGEIRKAQERYVDKAAAISGVAAARIRDWVPTDGRDEAPKVNVLQALAQERGKPFTDEQKQQLIAAEKDRFAAIEQARKDARKR